MLCKVPVDVVAIIIMVLSIIVAIFLIVAAIVRQPFSLLGVFVGIFILFNVWMLFRARQANQLHESNLFHHAPAHASQGPSNQKPVISTGV
jgi:hypothetical protein